MIFLCFIRLGMILSAISTNFTVFNRSIMTLLFAYHSLTLYIARSLTSEYVQSSLCILGMHKDINFTYCNTFLTLHCCIPHPRLPPVCCCSQSTKIKRHGTHGFFGAYPNAIFHLTTRN